MPSNWKHGHMKINRRILSLQFEHFQNETSTFCLTRYTHSAKYQIVIPYIRFSKPARCIQSSSNGTWRYLSCTPANVIPSILVFPSLTPSLVHPNTMSSMFTHPESEHPAPLKPSSARFCVSSFRFRLEVGESVLLLWHRDGAERMFCRNLENLLYYLDT